MDNHAYCRVEVKQARSRATDEGVKVPRISTAKQNYQNWAVFIGDFVHESTSCCAFSARAEAINTYIDQKVYPVVFTWMGARWMCSEAKWQEFEQAMWSQAPFELDGVPYASYSSDRVRRLSDDYGNRTECACT